MTFDTNYRESIKVDSTKSLIFHREIRRYNYPSLATNLSGNERNGIKTLAKYSGLVHHIIHRVDDCDDQRFYNFTGRKNHSTIESSRGVYFIFRLRLLHSYFLVDNYFKSFVV